MALNGGVLMSKTCSYNEVCPFFQGRLKGAPHLAKHLKDQYCFKAYKTCARYMISKAIGEEHVPENMWPNERTQAEEAISVLKT